MFIFASGRLTPCALWIDMLHAYTRGYWLIAQHGSLATATIFFMDALSTASRSSSENRKMYPVVVGLEIDDKNECFLYTCTDTNFINRIESNVDMSEIQTGGNVGPFFIRPYRI
jgi:hypothetical protein